MIRTLVAIRLRALLASLTAQGRQKKKSNIGTMILFAVLYLYVGAVMLATMGFLFYALAEPYHSIGLDWFYFSMSALMALGFSIIGSVFTTQSQLYDAKDNTLLLSMPIPPQAILLSRMIPLLLMNLLFAGMVMAPATVVYCIYVKCTVSVILGQLLALCAVVLLSQAISCLLGWLMHLLLSRLSKSLTSMIYMVVFLGLYFYVYSKANNILNTMITSGQDIADSLSWMWPICALGKGSAGQLLNTFGSLAVCGICFALAYWILSVTFLSSAIAGSSGRSRKKLDLSRSALRSPKNAIVSKELAKFLGTPVYLTNMGLGLLMMAALSVAGIWFRKDVLPVLELLQLQDYAGLIVCFVVAYMGSMICISCPSVSLEGKNIWVLKSMPISSRDILIAKLVMHSRLSIPVTAAAGLVLSIVYGCSIPEILLCTLACALVALLIGLIGMNAGLKWAKLDYISEAYPCKQSMAVAVTMFGSMGVPILLGLLYIFVLINCLSPMVYLAACTALLAGACFGLYKLMITWGAKKWDSL